MGSGLLSSRYMPSPASRSGWAPRPPSLGTLSYNKLFAWMRHGFPLASNSPITSSLKRKASWGSEAAVKLSIVEQGTESAAPCLFESSAVAAACFPSLPLNIPGHRDKDPLQPVVVDGDILLARVLLQVFLPVECVNSLRVWVAQLLLVHSLQPREQKLRRAVQPSPVCSGLWCVFAAGTLRCLGERLGGNFKSFQCFDGDWVNPNWIHSYLRSFYKLQRAGWL